MGAAPQHTRAVLRRARRETTVQVRRADEEVDRPHAAPPGRRSAAAGAGRLRDPRPAADAPAHAAPASRGAAGGRRRSPSRPTSSRRRRALARSPEGVDVWALVHRAQEGDAEAFGELYDHYVTMVHRYVYHRVGDRATAEDVTSETFVRALRRIDSLSFQGRDVGAWLVTIARNIILDHVKSSRYRLEVTTADMRDADRATDGPEDAVRRST